MREAFKSIEDDVTKMKRYVGTCRKPETPEDEKVAALEGLQFLVEDIDNANGNLVLITLPPPLR